MARSRISSLYPHQSNAEEAFNTVYLALKIRLGVLDVSIDQYPDPITEKPATPTVGQEGLSDTLLTFAGVVLRYLGNGLFSLGEKTFDSIRLKTEKSFLSYTSLITTWKSRVWANARDIDGRVFDSYKANIIPHAELIKRVQAVESIHKALENIGAIYNASVDPNNDNWSTSECDRAIVAMEKIGFKARNYDFLNTVSKKYANARKKQPMYLHGYTPKNILAIITRCEKLANYADPKYIAKFEKDYLNYTTKLEEFESETQLRYADAAAASEDGAVIEKADKTYKTDEHEAKIRAARLWWLAHFLKAAYTVTSDILSDVEQLALATQRSLSKSDDN